MKTPKLLPWIARKAGLDGDTAATLWARAAREAERRCNSADSSTYYTAAMQRFILLVERESGIVFDQPTPRLRSYQDIAGYVSRGELNRPVCIR